MIRLIRACALIMLLPAAASAAEKLPLQPDKPGVWRQMDHAHDAKQFTCPRRIVRRAICAIELLMACELRRDDTDDCARAHFFWRISGSRPLSKGSPGARIYFRIEEVRFIDDRDVWHEKRFDHHADKGPGAVTIGELLVVIRRVRCYVPCLPFSGYLQAFRLRKTGSRWQSLPFRGEHLYQIQDERDALIKEDHEKWKKEQEEK